jgi:hypothetical protein
MSFKPLFPLVAMLALAGSGCAAQVRPVPVTLPLPARPVLTPVTASQVQCLAPDAYTALVNRERALRTWGLELEAEINALNAKAGK